jgi:hypothetical protein
MNNRNNWKRLLLNECACGCGTRVAKRFAVGHARRRPLIDRLMEKVTKTDTCWLWTGAVGTSGYGRIGDGYRTDQVHRVAYELHVGPIPDGLHIDHLCRVKLCVNPDHLEAVTQAENNRRAAAARTVTHCKRGHEFTPENTLTTRGHRNCRACRNINARARRAERRAAA